MVTNNLSNCSLASTISIKYQESSPSIFRTTGNTGITFRIGKVEEEKVVFQDMPSKLLLNMGLLLD